MAVAEGVVDVGQIEIERGGLIGDERFRLFELVAEFSAEGFAANQLLVAAHFEVFRVWIRIGIVHRVNVDQFHIEIGICAGSGDRQMRGRRLRRR